MARLKPLWLQLAVLSARVRSAPALAVASDYDGTLTPIVKRPELAALPARSRRALASLARLEGVRVAVLSGRTLDDLARCLRLGGVFMSGTAGFETREESGRRRVHVSRAQRVPRRLLEELEAWCHRFPGAWLEDKKLSLALHYRAVPAARRVALGNGVRRLVRGYAGHAVLVHGKRVFEVMPAVARDKASALDGWLATHPRRVALFYFGDDTNDEPVHARVRRFGGLSIAVGRSRSRAEFSLPSPEDVVWFMEWLAREWIETRRERDGRRKRARRGPAA